MALLPGTKVNRIVERDEEKVLIEVLFRIEGKKFQKGNPWGHPNYG